MNPVIIRSIEWRRRSLRFLDQTRLPLEEIFIDASDVETVAEGIESLRLRGAPLIGVAAAFAAVLGVLPFRDAGSDACRTAFTASVVRLKRTRPTARNLFWALERMENVMRLIQTQDATVLVDALEREAAAILEEDRERCDAIGRHGAALIPADAVILTHCNTGALATGGIGTALGIIVTAFRSGKRLRVYADETRPLLQGARLTMWELMRHGIPATLITDDAAAWTIKSKNVSLIIAGADRIATNGDTANKIGTLNLAILAKRFGIPMIIAAPTSTIDPALASGDGIVIEEREGREVTEGCGRHIAPLQSEVFAPAFDVTPAELITAIVTERGVHRPPFEVSLPSGRRP